MPHACHALGCNFPVPPELFMCFKHWTMIPEHLQKAIKKHYRHGQCKDRKPSQAWIEAAKWAMNVVKNTEDLKKSHPQGFEP